MLLLHPLELSAHGIDVGKQSITREFEARNGAFSGVPMTATTGILNNHPNVAKISAVPHRRFNADFHGDTDDRESTDATVAQRDVQGRIVDTLGTDLISYSTESSAVICDAAGGEPRRVDRAASRGFHPASGAKLPGQSCA